MRPDLFESTGSKTIFSIILLCIFASLVTGQEASKNLISAHKKKAETIWKQLEKTHPDEFSRLNIFMDEHSQDAQYLPEVERLFLKHLKEKRSELNSRLIIQELKVDSLESSTSVTASQLPSGNLKFERGSTVGYLLDGRENLLGHGAIHRWAGLVAVQLPSRTGDVKTYKFVGDENDPITFGLIYEVGWVYLHGTGKVFLPDGKVLVPKESDGVSDETKRPTDKPGAAEQKLNDQANTSNPPASSTIVARIAYYTIIKEELQKRLMTELHPYDYDNYDENAEPVDAKTVLMKMVAEKAMIIEARAQGYLDNEAISTSVRRFSERKLVNLLLQKHVEGKINVTEAEITRKMQAETKLDKARAKTMVERAKTTVMLDQYYSRIYGKSRVKKLSQNFPRAIQIHERLLRNPKQARKVGFIRTSQVKDELTPAEKNIVLAQYISGKITLKDWFEALCDIVPPRRPRDLNTPKGVDQLLERALRMPLLVSEAKALRLDRNIDLLKQVRDYEDRRLLSEAMSAKRKELKEPTTEQIIAYFGRNKEAFGTSKSLKIDLIWCQDLKTAKQARAALDSGKDFEAVRQQYSLEKQGKAFTTHPGSEGLFWKDLWAGDPNQIIGPVKGFYRQGISWRIVKILEKAPGKEKPYSSNMEGQIKSRIMSEQNKALIALYGKELLKKYPYQIYADRIKDINPLDIP